MSYYADLTPYNYRNHSKVELNVGWLEKDHEFNIGEVPVGFIEKLRKYGEQKFTINNTRGFQLCHLCDEQIVGEAIKCATSSCEVRIVGTHGDVYACPKMIIHYVEAHGYLPPQQFVDAVINGPEPGSEEYTNIIKSLPMHWEKRHPEESDVDHYEKLAQDMADRVAEEIDAQILKDILEKSQDFKKFTENYSSVMPAIYGMKKKNKKS